jgi:O-succinylbenzoic acid--CoA ligase
LIVEGHHYRFAQLDQKIDRLAQTLLDLGARPNRPLGCLTTQSESLVLLSLAAPRAGVALLPANPKLTPPQIDSLFAKAEPSLVLCDDLPKPGASDHWTPMTMLSDRPRPVSARSSSPDAVHLIIATSGSTGTPKGAMLTGRNLAAAVRASRRQLAIDRGDIWLGCLPTYHIGGLSVMFRCLEAGATMLLHRHFNVQAVTTDLEGGKVTHVSLVPAMLSQLLDAGCRPSSNLRWVLIGGAGLPVALAKRATSAGWPICPSYGMSEAGSQVATCIRIAEWHPGMAGEPLPGFTIGTTTDGRIRVRGPAVMSGYVNPTLTPGDGIDSDGWFETNDLGGLDDDGRLRVLGRSDDQLISGGENIHPAVVEDIVGRCPGVLSLGITARSDPTWGDLLVAVVVGTVDEMAFLDWCQSHVPSHLRPRAMIKTAALPLTSGGKLDRRALRKMV